jgi:pimeloyl-ACP methyl ester carboxylesterase
VPIRIIAFSYHVALDQWCIVLQASVRERRQIERAISALDDELCESAPDCRRLLDAMAAEVTPQFEAQAQNLRNNRPGTEVEVFKDAGHTLFVDESERFNALVLKFAASLSRR